MPLIPLDPDADDAYKIKRAMEAFPSLFTAAEKAAYGIKTPDAAIRSINEDDRATSTR